MPVYGIGIEIVELERVASLYEKHQHKFPERVLTDAELAQFESQSDPVLFLARRIAAKVAATRALGTGFNKGVTYQDFEVRHSSHGKSELMVQGEAGQLVLQFGVQKLFLSIADEKKYTVANVVLEK